MGVSSQQHRKIHAKGLIALLDACCTQFVQPEPSHQGSLDIEPVINVDLADEMREFLQ